MRSNGVQTGIWAIVGILRHQDLIRHVDTVLKMKRLDGITLSQLVLVD